MIVRGGSYFTPVLWALHWLPIFFQVYFKVLVMTYKCLQGLVQATFGTDSLF